ncbi:hypothetical protein SRHO_G00006640 [Serrasalmus rhombeus]
MRAIQTAHTQQLTDRPTFNEPVSDFLNHVSSTQTDLNATASPGHEQDVSGALNGNMDVQVANSQQHQTSRCGQQRRAPRRCHTVFRETSHRVAGDRLLGHGSCVARLSSHVQLAQFQSRGASGSRIVQILWRCEERVREINQPIRRKGDGEERSLYLSGIPASIARSKPAPQLSIGHKKKGSVHQGLASAQEISSDRWCCSCALRRACDDDCELQTQSDVSAKSEKQRASGEKEQPFKPTHL